MWSQTETIEMPLMMRGKDREPLYAARMLMRQALALLDEFSVSPAGAMLDMALHQLDRELALPPKDAADSC